VLGHLQRGGAPTSFDRVLATGSAARRSSWSARRIWHDGGLAPPDIIARRLREVVGQDEDGADGFDLLATARALGVTFGD
jgi:hypothetical protein